MKQFKLILLIFLFCNTLLSAPINFLPVTIQQPDGTRIQCFASGDEFFNWLHDADGYTIIQGQDGWYYYGKTIKGVVAPSQFKVGSSQPSNLQLNTWAKISKEEYKKQRDAMWAEVESIKSDPVRAPQQGTLNNIAVYIRFADDTEFTSTRQFYDDKLNSTSGSSLKSYFNEVSYGMLNIETSHYPSCAMTTNLSYQDIHNRNYYQPYNSATNPNGYSNSTERREREHTLLKNAIDWINIHSAVPSSLNIDADNDGFVDNVCFFIRGNSSGWSDLLWAHRWILYTYNVEINGKRVWDYTFQPENQTNVTTMCHEMFHTLGAPDLYHYYYDTQIAPVGQWDIMGSGAAHMSAYMKWKYTNQSWISNIPEITAPGTYTLHPLTSPTNNCFKIPSPNSTNEYFVVEYRQKTGTYESAIPGSGLIVYRVNSSCYGNADGPPDELYVFRPNGTLTTNGNPAQANFSANVGRTEINDTTNPSCFLSNGIPGGLDIWGITFSDSTISFNVGQPLTYEVTLESNPQGAGVLSGQGTYLSGDTVHITAIANPGYIFINWTENDNDFSALPSISFPVNENYQLVANFASYSMVCDTISNIEGTGVINTWLDGGYASGHNHSNWTQFAEKFTNVSQPQVDGIRVKVAIAENNYESQVIFKLYEDGPVPGNVITSKVVQMNTLIAGEWNYIEFDNPVITSGSYYLGYEIFYSPFNNIDTFAVYMSHYSQTSNNTAYALTSNGWFSYNNLITSVSPGTHLLIESVNCYEFYEVVLLNESPGGGELTGEGTYGSNTPVKVTATPNPGYVFTYWTIDENIVSQNQIYEFTITENQILKAYFQAITDYDEVTLKQVNVFPNPATESIQIEGAPAGTQVILTDLQGRIIFNDELLSSTEMIDLADYIAGIYILHFRNQDESVSKKIIKQ